MFGNIFNQKKEGDTSAAQQPSQTPVAGEQNAQPSGAATTVSPEPVTPSTQPTVTDPNASTPGTATEQTPPPANPTPTSSPVPSQDPNAPTVPPTGESQTPPVSPPTDAPANPAAAAPSANTSGSADGSQGNSTDLSALSHLDPRATQALTHAQEETKRIKEQFIEPDQVLIGLLYDEAIYSMLNEMGADGGKISKEIQANEKMGVYKGQPTLSKAAQEVFDQSYRDAKMRGANFIAPEDVLIVLFDPKYSTAKILEKHNLKKELVLDKFTKNPNSNYAKKTVLEKFGIDLTEEARAGRLDPVAGRDKEIDRMVHVLLRRTKNNPIIIGEPGVGKTALVEGIAQKIVQGGVPKDLQDKRIFQLDVASLVAGASHRGEFEERMRAVISEVLGSNNKIILFIDEIHALMGTGEGEGMNAANIIKPHLARGHFQLIGATTTIEYRKNFEKDKAFERRFQPVLADEPSEENAFEMLKVIRPKYEKFHRIQLPDDALKECVKLSKKYIGERYLPDKAVDLLDEAAAEVKLQIDSGNRGGSDATVKKSDIEKVVSAWTGIPITKLTEDESEKLLKLEDRIHHRLIDQEQAVSAVSEAVRRGRIGLAAANRPIASFVFLGPTGVGKTELAKTLAELLFGRDDAMARLDMSEYMEKHEVAKLIGAPPGYVGYEEGGQLTEAVRKKPYSIVLLDEIEKAHPDVFNILLQLLEDGRLTDNKGNTISFKNTIVICTSNIGSNTIQQFLSTKDPSVKRTQEEFDKSFKELTGKVREELIKFFRPELLNRFDEVVIFKPLQPEHMAGIARLGIAKTAKLLKEQGYNLQITERAIDQLAKDGYDPVYGARPLRRLIQTAIENPIALAIISKKFAPGDTIVIDYSDTTNEFIFNKGGAADKNLPPLTDEQFRTLLMQLANPDSVTNAVDRQRYVELHDRLVAVKADEKDANKQLATDILAVTVATALPQVQALRKQLETAREKGDTLASDILALASTIAQQIQASIKLKKILLEIITPDNIKDPNKKLRFMELHEKLTQESQRDNALALKILAVKEDTPAAEIDQLMDELKSAREQGDSLAEEILAVVNTELVEEAEAAHDQEPATKYKKVLKQIINPLYLADPENKHAFSQMYDKLQKAKGENNAIAAEILAITDITSDSDIMKIKLALEEAKAHNDPLATELVTLIENEIVREPQRKLKNEILHILNPMSAENPKERERYTAMQAKISDASGKGNQLAVTVLGVKETITYDEVQKLLAAVVKAAGQQDEIALMLIDEAGLDIATQDTVAETNKDAAMKGLLLHIANPASAGTEQETFKTLQAKLVEASGKGNQLAAAVLALKETASDEDIQKLINQMIEASSKRDEIALLVLDSVGFDNPTPSTQPTEASVSSEVETPPAVQPEQPLNVEAPAPAAPVADAGQITTPVGPVVDPAVPVTMVTQQIQSEPQPAAPTPTNAPADTGAGNAPMFQAPPAPNAGVDSTPPPAGGVAGNGAAMQPTISTYNYSGIPATSRPVNYIAPQSIQEEIE